MINTSTDDFQQWLRATVQNINADFVDQFGAMSDEEDLADSATELATWLKQGSLYDFEYAADSPNLEKNLERVKTVPFKQLRATIFGILKEITGELPGDQVGNLVDDINNDPTI